MTEWMPEMDVSEWIEYGRRRDWISEPFCDIHDVIPLTPVERNDLEIGSDPCITVIRLYENPEQKAEAEKDNP